MAVRPGTASPPTKAGTGQARNRNVQLAVHAQSKVERRTVPVLGADTGRSSVRYSTDADEARKLIARTGKVAVDLETDGFHPHKPNPKLQKYRDKYGKTEAQIGAVILRSGDRNFLLRELPDWWPEVLEDDSTQVTAANAKFDLMWMMDYFEARGVTLAKIRNVRDPMLSGQLVHKYRTKGGAAKAGNPGAWEGNSLAELLPEFLGVTIQKAIDHDDTYWPGPWTSEMREYMLEDIVHLPDLGDILDDEVRAQGQEQAAWIEQNVVSGTAWMTLNGITPDVHGWGCKQAEPVWHPQDGTSHNGSCTGQIARWRHMTLHMHKQHLKKAFPGVLNFNSPTQLMAAMPSVLGGPLPNTQKATLKQLAGDFPQLDMLLEYRHYQTLLKMWGPKYLSDFVCGNCGRFHPDWRQIGTETSRFSCGSPNLQQIPRDPEFRKLFVAAPGCSLASLDYSAIEVLAAAIFSGDRNLLAACATGDPHAAAARMTMGLTEEQWAGLEYHVRKDFRQSAKIVNFGLLFGGGAEGLVTQARDLFDTIISIGDARIMIAKYYRLFPMLKKQRNKAYEAMDSKDPVVEVRNAVGFRRYLEKFNRKPTSWLNTWIQSSAGYGLKASFSYFREAGLLPFLCAQVHDEVIFEFPGEPDDPEVQELANSAKECMIAGMRSVLGSEAPVNVEPNIAKIWSKG